MTINLTIHGTPVTKKNSQRILVNKATGRPFIMPSQQYKDYEKLALMQIRRTPEMPISTPVNVRCVYYMPTRRKADLCNLLEATCDILTSAGAIADDNSAIVAGHDGSRVMYDKADPRVEICLEDMP